MTNKQTQWEACWTNQLTMFSIDYDQTPQTPAKNNAANSITIIHSPQYIKLCCVSEGRCSISSCGILIELWSWSADTLWTIGISRHPGWCHSQFRRVETLCLGLIIPHLWLRALNSCTCIVGWLVCWRNSMFKELWLDWVLLQFNGEFDLFPVLTSIVWQ